MSCRKRQVERSSDGTVTHRCIHKLAETYRQPVTKSVCDACPVKVLLESKQVKKRISLPVIDTSDYPSCEFRRSGSEVTCGVTNLPVNADQCGQCAKESKMETARFKEKAVNYITAFRKWVAAGRPERTDEEVQYILDNFCNNGCTMYDKERKVCNSCGCPANNNMPAIKNKLKMATEECPLGQFPAKVKTNA